MKFILFIFVIVITSMACSFQIGDVVVLKSGGENMTVIDIGDDCSVYVAFFGYNQGSYGIQYRIFPEASVVIVTKE